MSVQRQMELQEGERRQQQVAFVQNGYSVLTQLGAVDARDKIACGDLVRRILQEISTESCGKLGLVKAGAIPPDDLTVPTPECDPLHRGEEISMHSVAARLNARIPRGKEGQVGKAIKQLYAARYGAAAASRIPKRAVPFHVKIFAESTYWQRDVDLVEQAVEEVVKQK
jgi:hypothetical protein